MTVVKRIEHGKRFTVRVGPPGGKVTIKTLKKRIPRNGSSRSHWQMEIETSVDDAKKQA